MRVLLSVSLLPLFGACSTAPPPAPPPPGQVQIAPRLTLTLPRPGDLGRRLEASQLVTARHGDQTYVFEGHLSSDSERFRMVGLDSLGRHLLSITWTNSGIVYDAAPGFPSSLRPENMLADIVLIYWPEAIVRQALAGSGGTLVSGPGFRSIMDGGEEVGHVDQGTDPWTGQLRYRNLAWGYQLDIQSVEMAP